MTDEKTILAEVAAESYDASEKPFDFIEEGKETLLLCKSDASIRGKVEKVFGELNCVVTKVDNTREALKSMRFHVYSYVVVNENFDTDNPDANLVLEYLEGLVTSIRRNIFVVLLSDRFRTVDNMAAFNKSVNIVVNTKDIDELTAIIKKGKADHQSFYHVFKESLTRTGRL